MFPNYFFLASKYARRYFVGLSLTSLTKDFESTSKLFILLCYSLSILCPVFNIFEDFFHARKYKIYTNGRKTRKIIILNNFPDFFPFSL